MGCCGFSPTGVRKIPCRRKWQPTPVCLPGESYGRRSLMGYSPWGSRVAHGRSDLARQLCDCPLSEPAGPLGAEFTGQRGQAERAADFRPVFQGRVRLCPG